MEIQQILGHKCYVLYDDHSRAGSIVKKWGNFCGVIDGFIFIQSEPDKVEAILLDNVVRLEIAVSGWVA